MVKKSENFGNIIAIVVTFNSGRECLENFTAILPQVSKLIIVDNDSDSRTQEVLKSFCDGNQHAELIINKRNLGLAAAQNIGIDKAEQHNAQWFMLFDDDSKPEANMIVEMQKAYHKHPNNDKVAIIAPAIKDTNTNKQQPYIISKGKFSFASVTFSDEQYIEVMCAICSGGMIKSSVIKSIGNMREEFFIDYIDTEFCLRVGAAGHKIIAVKNAILNHTLGAKTIHNMLNKKIIASNHSAERRFTIYRNRAIVWKEYIGKSAPYIIYDIMAAVYDILRILLLEEHKFQKVFQAIKGVAIGLFKPPQRR